IRNTFGEVAGYYSVSAGSVSRKEATRKIGANAPDPVPMALLGRLAVHKDMHKQGIGSALMRDAILRVAQAAELLGIKGIMVHAIDADAARFYAERGFRPSKIDERHLMISMLEVIAELSSPPKD
ncbi:MAG: GNAT family N-acetyltransferase, partial [Woeseiaceae bacterium]|nr:GNAT family N-acetyltransferase [Woeseiaceae bacterium]